jgi:hypothetical protein
MNSHVRSRGDDRVITGSECYLDLNVEWVTDTIVP